MVYSKPDGKLIIHEKDSGWRAPTLRERIRVFFGRGILHPSSCRCVRERS